MKLISRTFYSRNTVKVAKELLGKTLVRKTGNKIMSGIISETEAYRHTDDPASHAFRGITARNKVMFEGVGIAYVYFTYGMHYCVNVVAKSDKFDAGAVLIRSIIPKLGINEMIKNRNVESLSNLTNGPAKITQAMKITKKQYGENLTKQTSLYITEGIIPTKIKSGPRVGIKNGIDKKWNFKIEV